MADSVEFQLKMQDQASAPLKSAADNVLRLEQALNKLTGAIEKVTAEEKQASAEEEHNTEKGVEFGELKARAWEYLIEKVKEYSKELVESTIEITDFGYKAEVALRHLNGETEESSLRTNKMLAEARQFAIDAALPVESVTEAFLGLRRAGISDEWARPLTAAAGDLAALTEHPEKFAELTDVFAHIGSQGGIERAMRTLTANGVQASLLAKNLGLSATNAHDLGKELGQHPVGIETALSAIEETIRETAHEKTLGEVLKEDSSTIGGSVTKIKDIWAIMLDDVLNKKDSAFGNLREDFAHLVDSIGEHLPQIEAAFSKLIEPLLGAIDGLVKNPDALKDFFGSAVSEANVLTDKLEPLLTLMKAAGYLITGLEKGGEGIGMVAGALTQFHRLDEQQEVHQRLLAAQANPAELDQYGAKKAFADGGPVTETGPALVHEGEYVIPSGGALVRGGGGGGVHAPITVNVHVQGGSNLTEAGMRLMLEDLLPGALVSPLEKLAATQGAM